MMKGWKSWTGFGMIIVSAILKGLGYEDFSNVAGTIGTGVLGVGIAHKIDKTRQANE